MPAATPETTFAWKVANMERNLADGTVTTVHYTVSANDGTYSSSPPTAALGLLLLQACSNYLPWREGSA
jgi:hypothetical protein